MSRRSVFVVSCALILAACTGGGPPKPSATQAPHRGGEAVFGAEQWPECLNPINECSSANWTWYTVLEHVLPRAMQLDPKGNFVASPVLAEAPSLLNFGVQPGPPFRVAFRISPEAIWADGSPITSEDFRFTWRAIISTTGSYSTAGYDLIESIDTADPKTAVITFRDIYLDWPDLFGGVFHGLIERAAFPKFANSAKPNLAREMQNGIPFSGGPWILKSWSKDQAVFIRNDRYFGPPPLLDRVTLIPKVNPMDQRDSLIRGQVSAIYPTPWFTGGSLADAFRAPSVQTLAGDGPYLEALWFNHSKPPLDQPLVREALMYAIDRQAIVDQIVRPWNPHARVLNCGFVAFPDMGPWCETRPFERFTYDPSKARSLLATAGYDCSGTYCVRDGRVLEVDYSVVFSNPRRATTQRLLIDRARSAGFSLEAQNYGAQELFIDPSRLTLSDYATGGEMDPSVTEMFGCDQISKGTFYGRNWIHWCNREADRLMKESDRQLVPSRRLELMQQIYELEVADFVSLPLYVVPVVTAWRTDRIAGPVGVWNSSPYGTFFNMNEWYLAR